MSRRRERKAGAEEDDGFDRAMLTRRDWRLDAQLLLPDSHSNEKATFIPYVRIKYLSCCCEVVRIAKTSNRRWAEQAKYDS